MAIKNGRHHPRFQLSVCACTANGLQRMKRSNKDKKMKKITYKFPDDDPNFPGITAKGGKFCHLFGILAVRFATTTDDDRNICTKVKGRPELEGLHASYLRSQAAKKERAKQLKRDLSRPTRTRREKCT